MAEECATSSPASTRPLSCATGSGRPSATTWRWGTMPTGMASGERAGCPRPETIGPLSWMCPRDQVAIVPPGDAHRLALAALVDVEGTLKGAQRQQGWMTPPPGGARSPRPATPYRLQPWASDDSRTPSTGRRPTTFARLWPASEESRPSQRSEQRSHHCPSGLADRRRLARRPVSCSACWGPESPGTSQASVGASRRSLRSLGISRSIR